MFEHYLPNKNERATITPKSKFLQLNKAYDFNSFNLEKLRSAEATVTGMVNKILYAIAALGKQSCRFRNLRISSGPIFSLGMKSWRNLNSVYSSLASISDFPSLLRTASRLSQEDFKLLLSNDCNESEVNKKPKFFWYSWYCSNLLVSEAIAWSTIGIK